MSGVTEIERAVRNLAPQELAQFRDWFVQFDAEQWDRRFEADVAAGRLDGLAAEALNDLRQGKCKDL
jgi:hypothetical protein